MSAWIDRELLVKVLDGFAAQDRQLLELVFIEQCSYAEVARRLCIPEGTVKSRMSRCKDRASRDAGCSWVDHGEDLHASCQFPPSVVLERESRWSGRSRRGRASGGLYRLRSRARRADRVRPLPVRVRGPCGRTRAVGFERASRGIHRIVPYLVAASVSCPLSREPTGLPWIPPKSCRAAAARLPPCLMPVASTNSRPWNLVSQAAPRSTPRRACSGSRRSWTWGRTFRRTGFRDPRLDGSGPTGLDCVRFLVRRRTAPWPSSFRIPRAVSSPAEEVFARSTVSAGPPTPSRPGSFEPPESTLSCSQNPGRPPPAPSDSRSWSVDRAPRSSCRRRIVLAA